MGSNLTPTESTIYNDDRWELTQSCVVWYHRCTMPDKPRFFASRFRRPKPKQKLIYHRLRRRKTATTSTHRIPLQVDIYLDANTIEELMSVELFFHTPAYLIERDRIHLRWQRAIRRAGLWNTGKVKGGYVTFTQRDIQAAFALAFQRLTPEE